MPDRSLLALLQEILSGSSAQEQTALLNLVFTRLVTAGFTVSATGVMSSTVQPTWAGMGTVTSVALTVPGGFAIGGSPITTSGTLAITASGTSGGVLAFTAATTLASSGTLTLNGVVIGGGAGAAPSSTAAGTTNTVLHGITGAAPTYSAVVEADITLADNTTNNVSITRHGLAPKAPNVATQYLDGTGAYSTPAGGISPVYTAKTANYTAVANDLVACTANSFTVTLPAASSNANKMIWVVNNGTGTITIARTGTDTVGLATSKTLNPATATLQGDSMTFISDGTSNWNIV